MRQSLIMKYGKKDKRRLEKELKGEYFMVEDIRNYLDKFEEKAQKQFTILYELVYESTSESIKEKLWAGLPSFYVDKNFVRIILFKDHINVEAKAVLTHKEELKEYKITPKGMLQIFENQLIPNELLKVIFKESLEIFDDLFEN